MRGRKRQRKKNAKRLAHWNEWLRALRLMSEHCGFMAAAMKRMAGRKITGDSTPAPSTGETK
jgi:hypothetical protein